MNLQMPPNLLVEYKETPEAVAASAAFAWVELLRTHDAQDTPIHVALSGGRIARVFLEEVVRHIKASSIRPLIHYYWGDERCVPSDDPESNYRLAKESFLDPLGVATECIHRIPTERPPLVAAELAATELKALLPHNEMGCPMFDMIFLGVGEDAHIASLFPENLQTDLSRHEPCFPVLASKPPPERITLSYQVLWAAKNVWLLATGEAKRQAVRQSLDRTSSTPLGRLLQGRRQSVLWTDLDLAKPAP